MVSFGRLLLLLLMLLVLLVPLAMSIIQSIIAGTGVDWSKLLWTLFAVLATNILLWTLYYNIHNHPRRVLTLYYQIVDCCPCCCRKTTEGERNDAAVAAAIAEASLSNTEETAAAARGAAAAAAAFARLPSDRVGPSMHQQWLESNILAPSAPAEFSTWLESQQPTNTVPNHTVSNQPTYVQHNRRQADKLIKTQLRFHTRRGCAGYSVEEREYWPVFEVVTDDHDYQAGQHKHLRCFFKCAFPADVEETASLHTRHGYEGGQFVLDIRVPHNFPFVPPVVKFLTKIYHPCVNPNDGSINVDFLQGSWSPALNMTTMVLSIQSLIMSPVNLEESCFGLYDNPRDSTYLNMKMASAVTLRYAHVHPLNIKHHLHGCPTMEEQQTLWRTIVDHVTHQKLPEVSIMLILSFFPCLPAQLALLFGDGKHNQQMRLYRPSGSNEVSITSHVAVLQTFDHPKDKFYNKLKRITKTISAEGGSEGGEGEGGDY